MQRLSVLLVVLWTVCGFLPVHAAESSTELLKPDRLAATADVRRTNSDTATSQQSHSRSGGDGMSAAPECDGLPSSTGTVMARISRFVRSSVAVHAVQCPIPPVPDRSTQQEPHP